MRIPLAPAGLLALAACTAPAIDDWPPVAPPVDQAVIDRYVDRYVGDYKSPSYTADEVEALRILHMRRFRSGDNGAGDIERLRREQQEIRDSMSRDGDVTEPKPRSRNEINAIERRIDRRFESRHDRNYERLKLGL